MPEMSRADYDRISMAYVDRYHQCGEGVRLWPRRFAGGVRQVLPPESLSLADVRDLMRVAYGELGVEGMDFAGRLAPLD